MSAAENDAPAQVMWQGRYIRAIKQGRWEYASRARDIRAVVILAEVDGCWLLVEQMRVPIGRRCLELPAGLIGDEDAGAGVEDTAHKELVEETGYRAARIEVLGEFFSSPGMVAEGFTLVRAHGLEKVGDGGGVDGEEIVVNLVPKGEIRAFVAGRRAAGVGVDVKLLMLLGFADEA